MNNSPETELDLSKLFLPDWVKQPPTTGQIKEEGEVTEEVKESQPAHRAGRRERVRERGGKYIRPSRAERFKEKLPNLDVSFVLDPNDVEIIARQIRSTARAYPIFDIARLILRYPDRFSLKFTSRRSPEGELLQPLFICKLDDSVWLSEDEVAAYILETHFDDFYQTERIPTDPPKGKYTFVALCGLSGIILGPPNHHEYQSKLVKLHAERFSYMPFEEYKSHIRIVRDEEAVKKWIEEQSWKTQYICLNVPEPIRLESREAVDLHFKQVHLPNLVHKEGSITLVASKALNLKCRRLRRLARMNIIREKEFPIRLVRILSDQLTQMGLQFFKVKKITHVAVSRPRYLDFETTPVSENVKRIVKYVREHPGCTRKELIEALAPTPPMEIPITPGEGQIQSIEPQPTPEQLAIIADLHWLILQGHVVEFYNGKLDTAKKPSRANQKKSTFQHPSTPATGTMQQVTESASSSEPQAVSEAVGEAAQSEEIPEIEMQGATEASTETTALETRTSEDSFDADLPGVSETDEPPQPQS
jgi:hypothetical protein